MNDNLADDQSFFINYTDQIINLAVNESPNGLQCRVCRRLLPQDEAIDIFSPSCEILEKIHSHLFIFVSPNDLESKHICIDCYNQLECFSAFFHKVSPLESLSNADVYDENFNAVKEPNRENKMEVKEEPTFSLLAPFKVEPNVDQLSFPNLCAASSSADPVPFILKEKVLTDLEDNSSSGDALLFENNSRCEIFCDACNSIFISQEERNHHKCIPIHNNFFCHMCDLKFNGPLLYHRHIQVCRRNFLLSEQGNRLCFDGKSKNLEVFVCDICNASFNRSSLLMKHHLKHKPKSEWREKCNLCDMRFERHALLVRHLKTEHVDDQSSASSPWKCRHCGKHMMTKLSLGIHERIHTGAKPYVCEWCGQRFRSRANLLQHHPKHTGIKKHKCEECGKLFSRKSFVTAHMRVHTGERPYSCRVCNRKFTQIGDMRRHEKKHEISIKHGGTCYTVIDLSKSPSPDSVSSVDSDDKLTDSEIALKVKVIQD